MKLLLMADSAVGVEVYRYLATEYRQDLALVVTTNNNALSQYARSDGVDTIVYCGDEDFPDVLKKHGPNEGFDLGISSWWPKLIPASITELPRHGFINFHPSLLPFNRGKHYNFWALVEQCPFGVTLHYIGRDIDGGDIIMQRVVPYDWTDTGATLYKKAQQEIVDLFRKGYPDIRKGCVKPLQQDLNKGSFHLAEEMDPASRIELDTKYRARDLLNLLRARTFPGHPACYFYDNGQKYEVRIEITKVGP